MNKEEFLEDIQLIYNEITSRDKELYKFYELINGKEHKEALIVVKELLKICGMRDTPESRLGVLSRLIDLREDLLKQAMENQRFTENRIIEILSRVYIYVDKFYSDRFESLLAWIEEEALLTPFYRSLIYGVHTVGLSISQWQNSWSSHIVYGINRELFRLFNGDEDKIFEMLRRENLLDKYKNTLADRSYSVLIPTQDGYRRVSYVEAFAQEVREVSLALHTLVDTLEELDDEVYNQKEQWIRYFKTLNLAFNHNNPDELIGYWADVDRAWMNITTPIQVGHPLEYYEDRYRKAVALEWDLRIINPILQKCINIKDSIKDFTVEISSELPPKAQKILVNNIEQIEHTQLYIGRPALYYGAELNGLFSAQVVPNDEEVSFEFGKKIFAYADFVRDSKISKPVFKVTVEALGEEFIKKQKRLAKYHPTLWNEIYQISTIGHEFGHILWIDIDTETKMNLYGQFKNIEEFKATTSGLMGFFQNENILLKEYIIDDLVNRSISLIGWREVENVLPYYCEGLIHLEILWLSGVIKFNKISVEIDYSAYDRMKELYRIFYKDLIEFYINKNDASEYLFKFLKKRGKDYLPKIKEVRDFVTLYYDRYKNGGTEVVNYQNL